MRKTHARWTNRTLKCTVVAWSLLGFGAATEAFAEKKYSDWGPAVNLDADNLGGKLPCVINSITADRAGGISKDSLSLYLASFRAGGVGGEDLYVAQRESRDEPWGPPTNLGNVVNTSSNDNVPSLSRDEHWLFFISNRSDGFGSTDLWVSFREHVQDNFAWKRPFNLGSGVNAAGFDAGPGYFENEDGSSPLLFFNSDPLPFDPQNPRGDIFRSALQPDGTFGKAEPVTELNSPKADQRPSVRFDGLEIFFSSNRDGSTPRIDAEGNPVLDPQGVPVASDDIWVATRNSVHDDWQPPVKLGAAINTASTEITPHISPDGLTLLVASNRPGGCGGLDLYMNTRTKLERKDRQE